MILVMMYRIFATSLLFFYLASCSSVRSGRYLRLGEPYDLDSVVKIYQVTPESLRKENPGKNLEEGEWIFVPLRRGVFTQVYRQKKDRPSDLMPFIWPLTTETIAISSEFGYRKFRHHDGVDLPAQIGTKIRAVADGEVIIAKKLRGYGRAIIVSHTDSISTVYAHNSKNLVRVGHKVKQGDVIGLVGRTGRATGPHLHFEVRENGEPTNPMTYLPTDQDVNYQ
jgi:murein DD-endopeptidase MepM/ murein hydrolase activator NlpD